MVDGWKGGVPCYRKCLVSGLERVGGVLQRILCIGQGVFMDWEAVDGDHSLQGVFLADPGI